MTNKILLLSHGGLAKTMYETAQMIFGNIQDMSYLVLKPGCDLTVYKNAIQQKIKDAEKENLLVITDIFGGSPFMISSQLLGASANIDHLEIITGMNLAMVLQAASTSDTLEFDELIKTTETCGKEGIRCFKDAWRHRKEEA